LNVLLLNPTRTGMDTYVTPPLHLVYIAHAIRRAGHNSEILDVHYQYSKARNTNKAKFDFENEMIEEIMGRDFDLLGIGSIASGYHFSKRVVSALKRKKPKVPVIIGGGMSLSLKDLWQEKTDVDFLVESDGETVIQKVLDAYPNKKELKKIPGLYTRSNGKFISSKPDLPRNLDYIDFPDWDILDNLEDYMSIQKRWVNSTLPEELKLSSEDKVLPIVMTRGCPYKCTFCYHVNSIHRKHSIEYLVNYLKHLREKYNVSVLQTWDDLIMVDREWLSDLSVELASQNLDMRIFTSGGKPSFVTRKLIKDMRSGGFIRLSFGVESGSQKMLDIMKKRTTVLQNYEAVKVSVEEGMFVHVNMVLGMPGENLSTLKESSNFLVKLAREGIVNSKNVSFSYATGYPGTELYQYMIDHNIVSDTEEYLKNQTGVMGYKYNLCGLQMKILEHMHKITMLKMDFFHSLYYKRYFNALSGFLKNVTKLLARSFLSTNMISFIKKIVKLRV